MPYKTQGIHSISNSFTETINSVPAITVSSSVCNALTANSCLNPLRSVLWELVHFARYCYSICKSKGSDKAHKRHNRGVGHWIDPTARGRVKGAGSQERFNSQERGAKLREAEGRQEENVEKMRMRTYVRFGEVTMMMMKRHRKGGLNVMKGVVGVVPLLVCRSPWLLETKLRWLCPAYKDED